MIYRSSLTPHKKLRKEKLLIRFSRLQIKENCSFSLITLSLLLPWLHPFSKVSPQLKQSQDSISNSLLMLQFRTSFSLHILSFIFNFQSSYGTHTEANVSETTNGYKLLCCKGNLIVRLPSGINHC